MNQKVKTSAELINYIRPDAKQPGALYVQLARSLNRAIHEGLLEDGDFLLPQRELAEQLGVSRVTVRKAVESLVQEGLLEQRQGAGTLVTRGKKQHIYKNLAVLSSFTEDMESRGMVPSSTWVARETLKASPKEIVALNLSPGSLVSRLTRIRYASDTPIAYEIACIPAHVIDNVNEIEDSLYAVLDEKESRPVRALQTMTALNADQVVAEFLNIAPKDAVLYIERQGFIANESPIEFTRSWYRGDIYDFVTELTFK